MNKISVSQDRRISRMVFILLFCAVIVKALSLGDSFTANLARLVQVPAGDFSMVSISAASDRYEIFESFDRCLSFFDQSRLDEAASACRTGGVPARYWYVYGALERETHPGEVPEIAIQAYRLALQLDPSYMDARVQLAVLYEQLGQPEEVIRLLELALAPEESLNADIYRLLGSAYASEKRYLEAENVLIAGLQQFPDDDQLILVLANAYYDAGSSESAARWYDTYLEGRGSSPAYVLDRRARIAAGQEDWNALIDACSRLIVQNPENTWCLQELAAAYLLLGEPGPAAVYLHELLALDPENEWAAETLEQIEP